MNQKRAFLLAEETLKIIIAVISIGILLFLLGKLYFSSQNSKELQLAQASLEHLVKEIEAGHERVVIYNPKSWDILSWPFEGEKPVSCSSKNWDNCICICKKSSLRFPTHGNYLDFCDKNGVCMEVSSRVVVKVGEEQLPIRIRPPLELSINYKDQIIIKNER